MKNDFSSKSISNTSSNNKRSLRQKDRIDYSNVPESYHSNIAIGINNGRWSLEEHKKFITGVFIHGNNWKDITNVIGTRNCAQARSHGQKFFTKLAKMNLEGVTEELCNVKKLHHLYETSNNEDLKMLYFTLTDVAYNCMDNDSSETCSTIQKLRSKESDIVETNINSVSQYLQVDSNITINDKGIDMLI